MIEYVTFSDGGIYIHIKKDKDSLREGLEVVEVWMRSLKRREDRIALETPWHDLILEAGRAWEVVA